MTEVIQRQDNSLPLDETRRLPDILAAAAVEVTANGEQR
jgi:hypothetical protein